MPGDPIVATGAEAQAFEFGAAIVLDPLREFMDEKGLGAGPLEATEIGGGHSNLTFLIRRKQDRFVLRRAPRGEISESANDVLREARILEALAGASVPTPRVLAQCEDRGLIGAPFCLMSHVPGTPINDGLPPDLVGPDAPRRILEATVNALVELHGTDLATTGLDGFGKPAGYLERQLRRFDALLDANATRPLDTLEWVGDWLARNIPRTSESVFVHGDYRLGNLMFAAPLHLSAVLDWEMATVGDPLADLGYLTAMWFECSDDPNPMFALSAITSQPGFPGRDEVADRYSNAAGSAIVDLPWYQVLALWKSAIFLEGSFRRYRDGASGDPYFADLDEGVPALGRAAREWIRRAE